jgi:hypothetical protein
VWSQFPAGDWVYEIARGVERDMVLNTTPQLIGIYQVKSMPDVSLIEIKINIPASEVNVSSFTQQDDSISKEDWQVAYDEHFLNGDGTKVIGTFIDHSNLVAAEARIAFFMYFVDVSKPLISQYGEIFLSAPIQIPERLAKIIDFEPAD